MNFWQQHIVNEQGFEATKFTLAIADSYSELLSDSMNDGNRVDIIQLNDNFKDALNTDESSFKVKELSFSVDELSCHNDVNINCLSFLLECKKRSNTRYIALYETKGATALSFANMLFLGKLDTKVTGDDIVWDTNSIYTHDIKAKRFYKFNALEFSIAVLDECSINKEIRDETGTLIQNIYQRTTRAEIEALQETLAVKTGTVVGSGVSYTLNHRPLINLFDLLNYLLGKAESLISDLLGYTLSINLIESDIGYKGLPTNIKDITRYSSGYTYYETSIDDSELSQAKEIYITDTENSTKSSIWLSAGIFDPFIIYEAGLENKFTDFAHFEQEKKNLMTSYFAYSFRNLSNLSDLLFEIAKSLGCYVVTNSSLVAGVLTINIEFKSRKAFNDATVIYPIGATDGSLDTSGESESSATEYYGEVHNFATDGIDTFDKIDASKRLFNFSKNFESAKSKRDQNSKIKKTDYKRLLLSSGVTLVKTTDNDIHIQNVYGTGGALAYSPAEYMFSNLMIMKSNYGSNWARPIQSILWKDNGINKNTSLVEYVNSITANNREFYKTEYTLTVPYYSAFAIKDGSGAITSIGSENLKIGRTIRIKERKKAFVTGSWVDFSEDVDFKIIEIEKNLTTPEIKLKLQSISAFAYGVYDGDGSEILGAFDNNDSSGGGIGLVGNSFLYYEIDSASDDILNGDRVVITENQKLIKAKAHSDHYGLDFGFAKNSGVSGDFIPVDTGDLSFCNDYTLTPLDVVFVRTGDDTTSNISQTGISDITGGENLYYKIGTALSPTVIKVETEQYEFE